MNDGVHPSTEGHRLIADELIEMITGVAPY